MIQDEMWRSALCVMDKLYVDAYLSSKFYNLSFY